MTTLLFGIALAKDAFLKLKILLSKISLNTNRDLLNCYVISTVLYDSECCKISLQVTRKMEAIENWFY